LTGQTQQSFHQSPNRSVDRQAGLQVESESKLTCLFSTKSTARYSMGNRRNQRCQRCIAALPAWFMLAMALMVSKANAQHSLITQSADALASQRSRDLSDVGTAKDICEAVGAFHKEGHIRDVLLHEVPETQLKNDGSLAEIRSLMTDHGWIEAARGDFGISHYQEQTFEIRRIQLTDEPPSAWVFSTSVGSLHNPLHWVLSSTPDGKRADHLLLQVGFEASGYFDTAFVRFHGTPFAVGVWNGEIGPWAEVYRLDPGQTICSFDPRK
jgi:hypothetical protein